jgi:hypothetical protein
MLTTAIAVNILWGFKEQLQSDRNNDVKRGPEKQKRHDCDKGANKQ